MPGIRNALHRLRTTGKRLRSLVRDEDHDDWYERHADKQDKPPNLMGPGSQSGG
jgi:hypothetical protein